MRDVLIEKDVSIESPETKLQRISASSGIVAFKSCRRFPPSSSPPSALESQKLCMPRRTRQAATLQVKKEEGDKGATACSLRRDTTLLFVSSMAQRDGEATTAFPPRFIAWVNRCRQWLHYWKMDLQAALHICICIEVTLEDRCLVDEEQQPWLTLLDAAL